MEHQEVLVQEQNGVQEISLKKRFFNFHTLLSFAVAFAILYFLATRVDLNFGELWRDISGANPYLYIMALVVYYASFPLRGARWRLLLGNVGYHRSTGVKLPSMLGLSEIIFLAWFANCIVPAKLGDMYRAYLLKKNANVSFSKTFGTILAERIIDMVVLFSLMALSALALIRSQDAGTALNIIGVGLLFVAIIGIGLVAMVRFGSRIEARLPKRVQSFYGRFQEGTLGSFQNLPTLALISVVVWLTEAGRLYFVTQALSVQIGLPMILFAALANSLLTTLPLTPGGIGVVEAGVAGLLMMEINRGDAISVAVLDRTISYGSLALFGFLVYLVSRKK